MTNEIAHRRAVRSYRKGTAHRWVACLAASRIVGKYEKGATSSLATDLAVSIDQIERMARAGVMYRYVRSYLGPELHRIREKLSYSHFGVVAELWKRYEFSFEDAADYLRTAAEEGTSVAYLRKIITDQHDWDETPEWRKRLDKIIKEIEKLKNDYGLSEELRELAFDFIERANEYILLHGKW